MPLFVVSKNLYRQLKSVSLFTPLENLARCDSCGYGKYLADISNKDLNDYYTYFYWQNKDDDCDFDLNPKAYKQWRYVSDKIKIGSIRKALEIGAGSAGFSRVLKEHIGENEVRVGVIEPAEKYERMYKKEGLKKEADFFPVILSRKYDYIHMSHWLEHALDLGKVMSAIVNLLETNSHVYVEVPNCGKDYFASNSRDLPHIHFFSDKSLRLLFSKWGFSPIDVSTNGDDNKWLRGIFRYKNNN